MTITQHCDEPPPAGAEAASVVGNDFAYWDTAIGAKSVRSCAVAELTVRFWINQPVMTNEDDTGWITGIFLPKSQGIEPNIEPSLTARSLDAAL